MATRTTDDAVRRTRVFKSGNSRAVRLPADWGLEAGQEVHVRRDAGRVVIEPVPQRYDLTGIAGAIPGLGAIIEEHRAADVERDLDWGGKFLKHD